MSSMLEKKILPSGSKVFIGEEVQKKRDIEEQIRGIFSLWGFQEIITPSFEFYAPDKESDSRDSEIFKTVDLETGNLLSLRSDVTPQIAQIAGTVLESAPRPLRFSYVTNVFRYMNVSGTYQREFLQAGVELIGLMSLEADAEVIAIAVECFRKIGVKDFKISLSHGGFLAGIFNVLDLTQDDKVKISEAISRRDESSLAQLLKGKKNGQKDANILKNLARLFGDSSVLEFAEKTVENATSKKAVQELKKVYGILDLYGLTEQIVFDLADFRDFNYYTGVIFEGFVSGVGSPVCGGGRYDRLLKNFGTDDLGTGFAIDLDSLSNVVNNSDNEVNKKSFLVVDFSSSKKNGIEISRKLRDLGYVASRDIMRRELKDSLTFARQSKFDYCLVIDTKNVRAKKVRVLTSSGVELIVSSIDEIVNKLEEGDIL